MHSEETFDGGSWEPPEEVRLHTGDLVPDTMEFFVDPPAEIGRVSTAFSTLKLGQRPPGFVETMLIRIGLCGAAAGGGFWIVEAAGIANLEWMGAFYAALGGAIGLYLAWLLTRFRHVCTFCGEFGVAELTMRGSRERAPERQMLLYAEAADLRTSQTQRKYKHSFYMHTEYQFQWDDSEGKTLLKLSGTYRSAEGKPKSSSPYWFAVAGQKGWNACYAGRMHREFEREGYVAFRMNRNDHVRVGPGFLEFVLSERVQRVSREEIQEFRLQGGKFEIRTKEARWFHNRGRYDIRYDALSNAQMFVVALEQLMGYRF